MGLNEAPRTSEARADTVRTETVRVRTVRADTVRVDIGELVLDGFDHVDPERLSAAFRTELARLVRDHGVPLATDGGRALDALSALPSLPATTSPWRLGEALARAVHAGLSGRGESR
ncbi:hypothetical protein [Streptomyces sp. NPDC056937]|uniref:hypothetical protein n=1 Tax=Streptomyces sp. NPDC056937 TaxID=3345969 RepID=UPI00363AE46D